MHCPNSKPYPSSANPSLNHILLKSVLHDKKQKRKKKAEKKTLLNLELDKTMCGISYKL